MQSGWKKMSKVIGVKIGTKSPKTQEKVYYYKTNDDYKRGDKLTIKVPSGGTPDAVVVIGDSKKKFNEIKNLDVR